MQREVSVARIGSAERMALAALRACSSRRVQALNDSLPFLLLCRGALRLEGRRQRGGVALARRPLVSNGAVGCSSAARRCTSLTYSGFFAVRWVFLMGVD